MRLLKKMFRGVASCLAIVPILTLAGCHRPEEKAETVTFTDMCGDVVTVPKNPNKVAVLGRSGVDMLVAFGLGDKIRGVYKSIKDNPWTDVLYPPTANYKTYDYDTTIEQYLEDEVDLVITPEQYQSVELREKGLPAFCVNQYGQPDYDNFVFHFADTIKLIWDDPAVAKKVETWKAEFEKVRAEIQTKLADTEITKSLYYVRGDKANKGINYTENSKSIQTTFANYLKLDCLGPTFLTNTPTIEALFAADPDYVLIGGTYQNSLLKEIQGEVWANLAAVKNNNVFNIGVGYVMFEQNGVELTIYLADIANKIYPDLFHFDIHNMLKKQMQLYFNKSLSDSEVSYMLSGLNVDGQPLA